MVLCFDYQINYGYERVSYHGQREFLRPRWGIILQTEMRKMGQSLHFNLYREGGEGTIYYPLISRPNL